MSFAIPDHQSLKPPTIRIIGVGGSGCNAIDYMISQRIEGVEVIGINSDAAALEKCQSPIKLLLGEDGKGAGDKPEIGRELAEKSREKITEILQGSDMVIITTGMGGGTGTGASPVIAEIAKKMKILTLGIVTKPFKYEGSRCMQTANVGITAMASNVDSLIVILNENLSKLEGADKWTFKEALSKVDEILYNAALGISQVNSRTGRINLDFNDLTTVMGDPGRCLMGYASAEGVDRARIVTEKALACPLLEGVDLTTAKSVLVNVIASKDFLQNEHAEIMQIIRTRMGEDLHLMAGLVLDDTLGNQIQLTIIATGLTSPESAQKSQPTQVNLKNATNNMRSPAPLNKAPLPSGRAVPPSDPNSSQTRNLEPQPMKIPSFLIRK